MWRLISNAMKPSIKDSDFYSNDDLAKKVWESPIGQCYCQALEYQLKEGYCASATTRSIVRSIPNHPSLPEMVYAPSVPPKVATLLDKFNLTESKVIYGTDGFDKFMETIRLVNNPKYRVGVNFLRSSLFGFAGLPILPWNFLIALFGGHFSPIVGYIEDKDLVAIFDVNANYGLYFVDSKRLFDSVNTVDIVSGATRGLVLSTLKE